MYTKGYEDPGGDIPRVVQEIAIGLCSEDDRLAISDERQCVVKRFLEDWEDDQPHIVEKIEGSIDEGVYLKIRTLSDKAIDFNAVCSWPELQSLKKLWSEAPDSVKKKVGLVPLVK